MTSAPPPRRPVLVGANPAVQLFDDAGDCTAYVSVWRVDWSDHGAGTALVLWQPSGVLLLAEDTGIGRWLATSFVRHFPELDGLPWHEPVVRHTPVGVELSLDSGLHASAGDVEVEIDGVLDRRAFETDEFALGNDVAGLRLVLAPCARGRITVAGTELPGGVTVTGTPARPSSSAFVTDAEVWLL